MGGAALPGLRRAYSLIFAGHEFLALFDRAAARDFADVYVLARRFGKEALIPVPSGSSAAELRAFYAAWRSELTA